MQSVVLLCRLIDDNCVKMKKIQVLIFLLMSNLIYGQTGTSGDPYTALGQVWHVPSDGIYYFDIGGTAFSTYVEAGSGWLLIASGIGATTESSYSTTSSLTLQSDLILPASIYTSALITAVRMNATGGPNLPFDVESSNATVLANLQNDRTLSVGTNSSDWTGTGTAKLARSCASGNASLSSRIYHACGNADNMHWQVGRKTEHEKIDYSSATKNDLNLWVRAASVPLPVELLFFQVELRADQQVSVAWQTASEVNNAYFTVERSSDAKSWEMLTTINGAGNSAITRNYATIDETPYTGTSYYRLKQTDLDGQIVYSSIRSVRNKKINDPSVYLFPNPAQNQIVVLGERLNPGELKFYNVVGQEVTGQTALTTDSDKK